MFIRTLLSCSALVFCLCNCGTPKNTNISTQTKDCPVWISYESAFAEIRINDGKIFYSTTRHEVPNNSPVAHGTPVTTVLLDNVLFSDTETKKLKEAITTSGFFDLDKDAYGGSEQNRFYPYTIHIKMDCKEKKILFRSNPDAEDAPDAFKKTEKILLDLAEQKK